MVNWRRNLEQKSLKECVKILKYKLIYISIIYLSSIKIYFICFRNLNVTFKIYIKLFEIKHVYLISITFTFLLTKIKTKSYWCLGTIVRQNIKDSNDVLPFLLYFFVYYLILLFNIVFCWNLRLITCFDLSFIWFL